MFVFSLACFALLAILLLLPAACRCFLLHRYYDLKPADLGELVKLPRMGKTLHRLVHQFPRVELAASVQPITRALLRVELTITPDFLFDQKVRLACTYKEAS